MLLGVPRESFPGERRVAIVPQAAVVLKKLGLDIIVEAGAGVQAGFPDAAYAANGARIAPLRAEVFATADLLVQIRAGGANPKSAADLESLRDGQWVIGQFDPLGAPQQLLAIAARRVTAFSLELLPRITRAQSMDVLSSMATITGYKAVLLAASTLPQMFPLLMTAAGTLTPARVLVVGAGVAGLQAIATARKLGAIVQAYDVRPGVKEQIESLGAKFVDLSLGGAEGQGGYAQKMDDDFYRKQREGLAKVVATSDVVITTALIPGQKSPLLITTEMTRGMAPGSVIVDLAAERGGNCESTRPGETVITSEGITILGPLNLASEVPRHASQMYSNNVVSFLRSIVSKGKRKLDVKDEVVGGTLVTHSGEVVHAQIREALSLPATTWTSPIVEEEVEIPKTMKLVD